MVKFNNYPPVEPGDIELTDAAIKVLKDASNNIFRHYGKSYEDNTEGLNEHHRDAIEMVRNSTVLSTYGNAIGQVIAAAVTRTTMEVCISEPEQTNTLTQDIFDQFDAEVSPANAYARKSFRESFQDGVIAQFKLRANGVPA